MTELIGENNDRSAFPRKSVFWTVLAAILIGVLFLFRDQMIAGGNVLPAIPWIVAAGLILITVFVWAGWAFTRSNWGLGLTILAAPAVLLTLYYPDFGGDMNFMTFRPRFWAPRIANYVVPETGPVNVNEFQTTAYDFPQFLGPDRDLSIEQIQLESDWQQRPPELLWKIDVGDGWSGFAVVNGLAYTQEQRDSMEVVSCYDIRDGAAVWIYESQRRHEDSMAMGKAGPRATPTIANGKVYATSGTGVLDCLDAMTGDLVWTVNVPSLVGIQQKQHTNSRGLKYTMEDSVLAWGRSCSPLVVDQNVIVSAGGPAKSGAAVTMIAFDAKTGQEVWRGGDRQIGYSSPSLTTVNGVSQITLVAQDHAVGHDPETGQELWSWRRDGNSSSDANCSQVTELGGNRFLLTKGYAMGAEIIEVSQPDNAEGAQTWSVESLGSNRRLLRTKFTNPVIIGDHVYAINDTMLECVELLDEEPYMRRKWLQRGRFGFGQILAVGDKLLVHSEYGQLYLVDTDPDEYRELGKIDTIEGFCWNTIALYGDLLLVRSQLEAACFRLPIVGEPIAETQFETVTATGAVGQTKASNEASPHSEDSVDG